MPVKTKEKKTLTITPNRLEAVSEDVFEDEIDGKSSHQLEDDPSWIPSKRQIVRNKKQLSGRGIKKSSNDDQSPNNSPTAITPTNSNSTPTSTNPTLSQYPLKQSNINQYVASPVTATPSSENGISSEKIRLKERKSKFTLNSYLTLSLDSAEESISLIDSSASSNIKGRKRRPGLKASSSRSPGQLDPSSSSILSKQKALLMRSSSNDSTNSNKGRGNGLHYYYKSEDLPSTHEQHLTYSPYYRALFGNTAALPNGEQAEIITSTHHTLSQDSNDSIISKGSSMNSPSHPRLRTESHDSSTSSSSTSSSSSSSDEEQDRNLKRSYSSGSTHSHSHTAQLRRLHSHSTSNHNLRRAIYNASVIVPNDANSTHNTNTTRTEPIQANATSGEEEDDSEGSKEEKNDIIEVNVAIGEISMPRLTLDTSIITGNDSTGPPKLHNYNEEYPVLRSPKTASQLLLESKGFSSPRTPGNVYHSPSSSHKTAGTPTTATKSSLGNEAVQSTPNFSSSNKLSIITNMQQFMLMTPPPNHIDNATPHSKPQRSPRVFDVTSATKKRITTPSNSHANDLFSRRVISLNEEGKETEQLSPKNDQPSSTSFSPFRKEIPESYFFSPPNVIPGISSPFMSPSTSFQQLARESSERNFISSQGTATATALLSSAKAQSFRMMKSNDSTDSTSRLITFQSSDGEETLRRRSSAEYEDDNDLGSDVMLMSKSKSRSVETFEDDYSPSLDDDEEEVEIELPTEGLKQFNDSSSNAMGAIDVLVRNRSPVFRIASDSQNKATVSTSPETLLLPPIPLTRQPSFQDTTQFIVDKVKVSRFIYTKFISDAIPKASAQPIATVRRWDDPDSESDEENNNDGGEGEEEGTGDVNFMNQLTELVEQYHSQLSITEATINQKKDKKFFLFEKQYYHPLTQHTNQVTEEETEREKGKKNKNSKKQTKEYTKKEVKKEKQKLKESLLTFEEIDFLWFHKLIANYLQEENVRYFHIFTSLTANHDKEEEEEEDEDEEDNENMNDNDDNLHKICQYLISSHFYYYLFSQLPNEDQRFSSKIYELMKILYIQIHQNDMMKYYEKSNSDDIQQEKVKIKYLKNLIDRNQLARPNNTPSTTNTNTVGCSSFDSSEGLSGSGGSGGETAGHYHCQSYDSCDSMMSYSSCEGEGAYREIPLVMLESLYLVCQERHSRCVTSSKQSYEQELDVNFIAQKGFLSISSTVHHFEHPVQTNDTANDFPWIQAKATSSPSPNAAPAHSSSPLTDHIHHSLTTHYSLHSVIQAKEERQPFRINDSDYYLVEFMKHILKYEFEYMVSRLYNGIFDITLVIKNMMVMKYLCLSLFEVMKCYGNRLGLTSELVEHPQALQQVLEVMEGLILMYQMILFELECIENNITNSDEAEEDDEGAGGGEVDHYVVILLQKVYMLLCCSTNSHHNTNNLFYLLLHFIHSQYKTNTTVNEESEEVREGTNSHKNYAQEILFIKLFELAVQYLPPDKILFPYTSMYDQTLPSSLPPPSSTPSLQSKAPVIVLPSITMNVNQKHLHFIKQIFYKMLMSLDYHNHFKIIQAIFSFFFNHHSLLLYQFCFAMDFSFFLEELNTNKSQLTESNATTTVMTSQQRHYQQKVKETKQFNAQNEERLQLLVEKLRVLRHEYWNPMVKNVASQLLDLIFYQMEQLEENRDDADN